MEKYKTQRQIDYELAGKRIYEATQNDTRIKELREQLKSLLVNFAVHGLVNGELYPFFTDKKIQDAYDRTVSLIEERHEEIKEQVFRDYQ
ncbi:hypothetical protein [Sphingobacterium multivorum]|uniref:hypothetical protein n=1 Tax=Sphingobacterium multivorum TaxID=28454 RepID=UPI0031B9D872